MSGNKRQELPRCSTSTEELERALSADASSASSVVDRAAAAAPSAAALAWRLVGRLALLPTEPPDWRSAPPLCGSQGPVLSQRWCMGHSAGYTLAQLAVPNCKDHARWHALPAHPQGDVERTCSERPTSPFGVARPARCCLPSALWGEPSDSADCLSARAA